MALLIEVYLVSGAVSLWLGSEYVRKVKKGRTFSTWLPVFLASALSAHVISLDTLIEIFNRTCL